MESDQKTKIFEHIQWHITRQNADSLLDIGAGDEWLAKKLAALVTRYTAVERDEWRAQKLSKAGLDVIGSEFPTQLSQTYDIVLSSHSIPERAELYRTFIDEAWKIVAPGGVLIILTFKGGTGDITRISKEVIGVDEIFDNELFETCITAMRDLGHLEEERFNSKYSDTSVGLITDIVTSSLKENVDLKENRRIQKYISEYLREGDRYAVRTEHVCLSVRKAIE